MWHLSKLFLIIEMSLTVSLFPLICVFAWIREIYCWLYINNVKSISGEVAVVTGAGRGLGKEICMQLAKQGSHIAVVDIDIEAAENTAQSIREKFNVRAKAYKVDVSNAEQVLKLSQQITHDLGVATILVNNAGILMLSTMNQPHCSEVQKMINVNLAAHFWTLDAFLPKMKELGRGHVVAISSLSSVCAVPFIGPYTATKAGVCGLMRVLRSELRALNFKDIHTTTVLPYFLDTNPAVAALLGKQEHLVTSKTVSGENTAKRIVDGMLRNEIQITIPAVFSLLLRMLKCFPISWQELIMFRYANFKPDFYFAEKPLNVLKKNK